MKKENCTDRRSGIELLKIIAMLMIVVSHVTQTLYSENIHYASDYVIDIKQATTSIQQLILLLFSFCGEQGNLIFFTCSAWFLLESKKVNHRKIFCILADVWVISIIFLGVMRIFSDYDITFVDTIKSMLPFTFATNWYITCYVLFYVIHVWLNHIIERLTQKQLLGSCIIMIVLYFGINFFKDGLFFTSNLVIFIVVYFVMAYVKLYMSAFCHSLYKNIAVLFVGILGTCILTLVTNYLGLHIGFFSNRVNYWSGNNSPFFLIVAISLFNLFNKMNCKNKIINSVSKLSLLIYVIHENLLFRTYIRPQIWSYIYSEFGYKNVLLWDIAYASALFGTSILVAAIYKLLVQNWLHGIVSKLSDRIVNVYSALCDRIINRTQNGGR